MDIGGGNGFVAAALVQAGFPTVVVEPGKVGANNAKRRGITTVICATFEELNLRPETVPAVGLFDVLEHIENDSAFLRYCHDRLVTGGILYITVPALTALWSDEDCLAEHYRRYSLRHLSRELASAGFHIEFATYFFQWLPLPIFLFRTLPYRFGLARTHKKAIDSPRGHELKPRPLAILLERLLARETRCILARKSLSFGSSCLVVARKK